MSASLRATAAAYDNTSSVSLTIPSTVQTGDAMLLAFGINDGNGASTPTTPSGWAVAGTPLTDSADKWVLYTKIATSGDATSTVSVAVSGQASGAHMGLIFYAAQGTDPTSPFNITQGTVDTSTGATHVAPNATTTVDNCLVVAIMLDRAGAQSTNFTATSGWTVQQQLKPSYGTAVMEGAAADKAGTTAGVVTGPTLTATATSSGHTALWTVGLAPLTAVQTARPVSDVTTTGWTASPASSPDAANLADQTDTTYLESPTAPSSSTLEVKLPVMSAAPNTVSARYALAGGATSGTVVMSLRQGSSTQIASWTDSAPSGTPTTVTNTLNGTQKAAVSDLTDLRIRLVVTAS